MDRRLFALGLAGALAACSQRPDAALFPLDAGRSWTYDVATVFDDPALPVERERLVFSAHGAETLDGAPAWRRSSSSGNDYWLRADGSGIYRVASRNPREATPRADMPPRYVLRQPYAVGTAWSVTTTSYVLRRRNEFPRELRHLARYKSLPMRFRVDALDQAVQTPAGMFKGCVRVRGDAEILLYSDVTFDWRNVPLTTREWYCPDVGLVRVERSEPSPTKLITGGSQTLELVQWRRPSGLLMESGIP